MIKYLTILSICLLPFLSKAQTANAGADKTIYLTQTNTATLDGSASTGSTFQWQEFSSDYMSGATITSPTSKVTTVTGLPQGVFYFRIKATSGGTSVYDSMRVIVDYDVPPRNAHLTRHIPFDEPEFAAKINDRSDTSNYIGLTRANKYYEPNDIPLGPDGPGTKLFYIERGRSNGFMVDSMRGKLYALIEDGWPWGTATGVTGQTYARSQITYNSQTWGVDTNTTYVYTLKFYFPQSVKDNFATDPDWGRIAMSGMHGNDDGSGYWQTSLGRNEMYFTDNNAGAEISMGSSDDFVNQTHTLRVIAREGSGYPNQDGFIKAELDGVQIYFDNDGKQGKTLGEDYEQTTGLYDYRRLIVNPDSLTRNKKFGLVTMSTDIYAINNNPTVNAGSDQNISSSSVSLSGTADDLGVSGNGTITSYQWFKISGGSATITSPTSSSTTVTGLETGTYKFQLKATDDSGIDGFDTVQVEVNISIDAPTLSVSGDQSITVDHTTLFATPIWASGHSGTVLWTKISGPGTTTIGSPASNNTTVSGLQTGTYVFRVTLTQDDGQTTYSEITVTVNLPVTPPQSVNVFIFGTPRIFINKN